MESLFALKTKLESKKLVTASGCWEWTGARIGDKRNYGQVWILGEKHPFRIHRVAAYVYKGLALDSPLYVCHKCDNGICFNPEHLFIGNSKSNQLDCVAKGRNPRIKAQMEQTHCLRGHPLDDSNTYLQGQKRSCKTCRRNATRIYYQKRRMCQVER